MPRRGRQLFTASAKLDWRPRTQLGAMSNEPTHATEVLTDGNDRLTPLTHAQMLIWLAQRNQPHLPHYNMAIVSTIRGDLDTDRFFDAVDRLRATTDVLRCVVVELDGLPYMRLVAEAPAEARSVVDLSSHECPRGALEEWANRRCRKPFHLTKQVFDAQLIKLAGDEWVWYYNTHHLFVDAVSCALIFRRLADLYTETLDASDERPQFLPFAEAGREATPSSTVERFWAKVGRCSSGPTSIHGVSATGSDSRSERISTSLDVDRRRQLTTALKDAGLYVLSDAVSEFCAMATVLASWLSRVGEGNTLTIGCPMHQRGTPAERQTIGLMIELYPLTVEVNRHDTFQSLFQRLSRQFVEMLKHARAGASSPAAQKLFNVVLNYIPVAMGPFGELPAEHVWLHSGHGDPHHLLRMNVHDFSGRDHLDLLFDVSQRFAPPQRERIVKQIQRLLNCFIDDPTQPLNDVFALDHAEQVALIHRGRGRDLQFAANSLDELFRARANQHPERIAVEDERSGSRKLTYSELDRMSDQAAGTLVDLGLAPGGIVYVELENSTDFLVAILATMKAGGRWLAVDPHWPAKRKALVLHDSHPDVVVHAGSHVSGGDATAEFRIDLMADGGPISRPVVDRERRVAESDAYVLYTSGSSGNPKGVCCRHESVINLLSDMEDRAGLEVGHRCAWWTRSTFDVSVYEVFSALLYGRTLVIPPPSLKRDTDQYLRWLVDRGIESAYLPPFMLEPLAQACEHPEEASRNRLRRILVGVEPIAHATLRRIAAELPACQIINGYGPTEATICATLFEVRGEGADPSESTEREVTPIGGAIANTQVLVLDEHGQLTPDGVPGELYLGGTGLAKGYLNDQELTRNRFVDASLLPALSAIDATQLPARFYRTGDLVVWLPGNQLRFIRRLDAQVKIRGLRIEPVEIEMALLSHEDVQECVVVDFESGGRRDLAAYIVPTRTIKTSRDADDDPFVDQLRGHLGALLPAALVPAVFIPMAELPRTAHDKVDREQLPDPLAVTRHEDGYVAPRTDTERRLADVWSQALGVERVGRRDNFFALGGDSLKSLRVAAESHRRGLVVSEADIFAYPVLAQLAKVVEAAARTAPDKPARSVSSDKQLSVEALAEIARQLKQADEDGQR